MKSRMSQGGRGQGQESVLERERLKGDKSKKKEKGAVHVKRAADSSENGIIV